MDETNESGEIDLGVLPDAKECGNCRLFKPVREEDGVWKGDCRIVPDRGLFSCHAAVCNAFLPRAKPLPKSMPQTSIRREKRAVGPTVVRAEKKPDYELPELGDMTRDELKQILAEVLNDTDVRLAPKWEGGTVVLKPRDPALQPKELPVDALLHKVVMVRDRLRVLEQKVNGNPKLSDAEKVELQQYVTKCYGSLTSFNLLFADKDDQFVGEKGKTSE